MYVCHAGVDGVKATIYTTSMDTPGRSELMGNDPAYLVYCISFTSSSFGCVRVCRTAAGMKSSLAYQGCPVCLHTWSPGTPMFQTKCVCDGYRRFTHERSRARESKVKHSGLVYEYGSRETRPLPEYRDTKMVRRACKFADRIGGSFLGHKILPMPISWPAFCFLRYLAGEMMHDSKVFTEMVVKCLVGKGPSDTSYSNWSKDAKHRRQSQVRGVFENIWPDNNGPLPWRLTANQRKLLDGRMQNVVWPHYMERLAYDGIHYFVCFFACFC